MDLSPHTSPHWPTGWQGSKGFFFLPLVNKIPGAIMAGSRGSIGRPLLREERRDTGSGGDAVRRCFLWVWVKMETNKPLALFFFAPRDRKEK